MSETSSLVVAEANGHATWANTWFWELLAEVLDPLRVTVIAAPVVMATMLSRKVFTRCQPSLMTRYHLLSLARADRSSPAPALDPADEDDVVPEPTVHPAPACDNLPCELFSLWAWTSLLANEGSSVSIYKTDSYGEIPPSPFLSLLGSHDPATRRFLRRSLRRLSYVAIMPMATHIQTTLCSSALVPRRLEELFVQVMPRGVDLSAFSYEGIEMEDLIMERDSVYGLLFAGIFVPGPAPEWDPLRVFETGDAESDEVAWAEAKEAVRASSSCWDVDGRGRFVRNLARESERRQRGRS